MVTFSRLLSTQRLPWKSNTLFTLLSCLCLSLILMKASQFLGIGRRALAEASTPSSLNTTDTSATKKDPGSAESSTPSKDPGKNASPGQKDAATSSDASKVGSSEKKDDTSNEIKESIIGLKAGEVFATEEKIQHPLPTPPEKTENRNYNPLTMSLEEFKVLESLSERRAALEEKERKLAVRGDYILALEKRVQNKIDEFQNIRKTIEDLLSRYKVQEKENVTSLVKIYEKMKPKEAARIFTALDMPVLLNVVSQMNESKASDIISFMDTQRAKELTVALSRERRKQAETLNQKKAGTP